MIFEVIPTLFDAFRSLSTRHESCGVVAGVPPALTASPTIPDPHPARVLLHEASHESYGVVAGVSPALEASPTTSDLHPARVLLHGAPRESYGVVVARLL